MTVVGCQLERQVGQVFGHWVGQCIMLGQQHLAHPLDLGRGIGHPLAAIACYQ